MIQCYSFIHREALASSQLWDDGGNVEYCMKLKDGASSFEHEGREFCPFC